MNTTYTSFGRKPSHLIRKLVLLLLLTSAYALGLMLLYQKLSGFPRIFFIIFSDCTVAIAAGFGARLLLVERNWFIRSMAAVVMTSSGLAILGYFSQWEIGLNLPWLLIGFVSYMDLGHLSLGNLTALSALWAWRRSKPIEEPVDIHDRPTEVYVQPSPAQSVQPRIRLPQRRSLNLGAFTRPRTRTFIRNEGRRLFRARPKLLTRQGANAVRRRNSRQRANVQLALVEEHRCPYCLEPVLRTDPGGVKECDVCHSLHHADCWAITGSCQVPHLN